MTDKLIRNLKVILSVEHAAAFKELLSNFDDHMKLKKVHYTQGRGLIRRVIASFDPSVPNLFYSNLKETFKTTSNLEKFSRKKGVETLGLHSQIKLCTAFHQLLQYCIRHKDLSKNVIQVEECVRVQDTLELLKRNLYKKEMEEKLMEQQEEDLDPPLQSVNILDIIDFSERQSPLPALKRLVRFMTAFKK